MGRNREWLVTVASSAGVAALVWIFVIRFLGIEDGVVQIVITLVAVSGVIGVLKNTIYGRTKYEPGSRITYGQRVDAVPNRTITSRAKIYWKNPRLRANLVFLLAVILVSIWIGSILIGIAAVGIFAALFRRTSYGKSNSDIDHFQQHDSGSEGATVRATEIPESESDLDAKKRDFDSMWSNRSRAPLFTLVVVAIIVILSVVLPLFGES